MTATTTATAALDDPKGPNEGIEQTSRGAVFPTSSGLGDPRQGAPVRGYDFGQPLSLPGLLASLSTTGFSATELGRAIAEVRRMLAWRSPDDASARCTIFLGYTSNQVSSGNRDIIRWLVEHRLVDAIVTTAGGIEEDFIKCLAPTYVLRKDHQQGSSNDGASMRRAGVNRIGNLMIPNDNYCKFEDWLTPIFDEMAAEQHSRASPFTPSQLIDRLGQHIGHPDSIYYHAHRNRIPVFCPAITDGSLGDMLYFYSYRDVPLFLDIVQDVRALNTLAVRAAASGMVVLGGGLVKHHIANANLMRNGADFAVFINTAHEFDGSDAGASPDEAVSWGKIRPDASPVKVCCDATIAFPLLVAGSFYQEHQDRLAQSTHKVLYL